MATALITTIQQNSPKAWEDFVLDMQERYPDFKQLASFSDFPIEFQIGAFKAYFDENSLELDVTNLSFEELKEQIKEGFVNQEQVVSHFS